MHCWIHINAALDVRVGRLALLGSKDYATALYAAILVMSLNILKPVMSLWLCNINYIGSENYTKAVW